MTGNSQISAIYILLYCALYIFTYIFDAKLLVFLLWNMYSGIFVTFQHLWYGLFVSDNQTIVKFRDLNKNRFNFFQWGSTTQSNGITRFYWAQYIYHVESDLAERVQIRDNDWDTHDCILWSVFSCTSWKAAKRLMPSCPWSVWVKFSLKSLIYQKPFHNTFLFVLA